MKKLLSSYPHLVKEWHPTKNGELKPEDFTHGSNQKVWWLCAKSHSHFSTIANRTTNNTGCPYCSGNKVGEDNNLLVVFPEIAREWHPTKNGELSPKDVTHGTAKKVWWLCPKGHTYDAKINARTSKNTKCPYCSGRRVGKGNDLLTVFPDIAKEWHPKKNGILTPQDVTSKSDKKVWWLCPENHEYSTSVKNRTAGGTNCPRCSNQSSEPEIRILSELKFLFDDVKSRYKIEGIEVDIFLPSINVAIEYDGKHWHKGKEDSDLRKNLFVKSHDINLLRVREHPLKALSGDDIVVQLSGTARSLEKHHLNEVVRKLLPFTADELKKKINAYLEEEGFQNDKLFKKYRSYFPYPFPEKSLIETHPSLVKEWDFDKNYPLKPENFSYGSGKEVWWVCEFGHSYRLSVNRRTTYSKVCPECPKPRKYSIAYFQKVAKKRGGKCLSPEYKNGHTKLNFSCNKGHTWTTRAYNMIREDNWCPYCEGKENSAEQLHLL